MSGREWLLWSLSGAGAVIPLTALAPWVQREGLNLPLFFRSIFDSPVDAMFGWDVIITAVALLAFAWVETSRLRIDHIWLPLLGAFLIGPSFGLPAFLALRERAIARAAIQPERA